MANVLTNLAADIYKAADIVGRELVGAIPAVTLNSNISQRVAKGDPIRASFTREPTLNTSWNPSMTIPEGDDQTVDNKTMVVDSFASVRIPYTGEDIRHLNNGIGFETVYGDQIVQAMRKITNRIESDLLTHIYQSAGNALGSSGTTPFASNFNDLADLRKLMVDRGCPWDGAVSLVMDTAAGVKLRQLASLYKVNESGGDELLRRGILLDIYGLMLRESAQVPLHTEGNQNGNWLVNNVAGYAVGDKSIAIDTGSGTFNIGDIVTFGGDTEKYVVAATTNATPLTLNSGLIEAIADNEAIATENSYRANVAFHRAAVELAVRPVAEPFGGDAAEDVMTVQDPVSGIIYNIGVYKGWHKAMIEVSCLYGYKAWKPDFITILQG